MSSRKKSESVPSTCRKITCPDFQFRAHGLRNFCVCLVWKLSCQFFKYTGYVTESRCQNHYIDRTSNRQELIHTIYMKWTITYICFTQRADKLFHFVFSSPHKLYPFSSTQPLSYFSIPSGARRARGSRASGIRMSAGLGTRLGSTEVPTLRGKDSEFAYDDGERSPSRLATCLFCARATTGTSTREPSRFTARDKALASSDNRYPGDPNPRRAIASVSILDRSRKHGAQPPRGSHNTRAMPPKGLWVTTSESPTRFFSGTNDARIILPVRGPGLQVTPSLQAGRFDDALSFLGGTTVSRRDDVKLVFGTGNVGAQGMSCEVW